MVLKGKTSEEQGMFSILNLSGFLWLVDFFCHRLEEGMSIAWFGWGLGFILLLFGVFVPFC